MMTASHPLIQAFKYVTFGMGTAAKRFARTVTEWPPERELSPKAEAFAWRLAAIYRRQLPWDLAEEALRRKVNHRWVNIGGNKLLLECSACKRQVWYRGSRAINAPCPGSPDPKPAKKVKAEKPTPPPVEAPGLFEERSQ